MKSANNRIARIISRLAVSIALLVAITPPIGYVAVALKDVNDSLAFKAVVKSTALSGLIASAPEVWMFAENRLQGLVAHEPVPLRNEQVMIFDANNELILAVGTPPERPLVRRSEPLYDAGRTVGRIEIVGSLRTLIIKSIVAAVLGAMLGVLVFIVMRTLPLRALRRVMDELFKEKNRAETTLNAISEAVVSTDAEGKIQYVNPMTEKLLGKSRAMLIGQPLPAVVNLFESTTGKAVKATLMSALGRGQVVSCGGNTELQRDDGTSIPIEERSAPIFDQEHHVVGGVIVLRDVSASRAFVQRRSWEATHDSLTSLINRREFDNRVKEAIHDAQNYGGHNVVCYLDLDRFKVVNDVCGHAAGDALLIGLARLMQSHIRESDTLARLGGDEFGFLLQACDINRGQVIVENVLAAIKDFQFYWETKAFTVGASIGMTLITPEHQKVSDVTGEADSACYLAKEQGGNRVRVYHASDVELAARRSEMSWVTRIQAAITEQRFVLYHQQYQSLQPEENSREHLEVLLRMIGEDGEIIAPGRFLPAAERYNLMPDIDRWVVQSVFSRYQSLVAQREGRAITCAINISGASINTEGFLDFIKSMTTQYKIEPQAICFELTETIAVNNLQVAAAFIRECRALGFLFALDDFGTGTSSFGYLKNLPVDYLKIDGSFVRDIEHDKIDHAMTETFNRIGHLMGMKTVAEYAENEEIVKHLQQIGVDFAQGYAICKPKPLFS